MTLQTLPPDASLERYVEQADALLVAQRAADPTAARLFREHHPRFGDPQHSWRARDISLAEVAEAALELTDAQLALARAYSYRDWGALAAHVSAASDPSSAVHRFERAAEAAIRGELRELDEQLHADPTLLRARSTRITRFDPALHRATLLHYVSANGVEGHRQRSPHNAVEIARRLLEAGAEVDALADMYGGSYATLSLLVSSSPPAHASVQVALIHTLLDFGASPDGIDSGAGMSPLQTALVFGFEAAAEVLVQRGARVDSLVVQAGLGRVHAVREQLATSSAAERHGALALAAQLGRAEVVAVLLDAGESPDRHNPAGFHAHSTALHQAALAGRLEVVRVLVERGARLDLRDTLWNATPLGWAQHAAQLEVVNYLESRGAP